ncbi:MAG: SDR family oxidoreductase [Arhodomonas sp.]|nr:SDR family oxidoreductase [Arhodomonas sp.]
MAETRAPVAIVTGAARGIGRAIARRSLDDGSRVVIADLDTTAAEVTTRELTDHGEVSHLIVDVGDEPAVGRLIDTVVHRVRPPGRPDQQRRSRRPEADRRAGRRRLASVIATDSQRHLSVQPRRRPALADSGGAIVNIASTRALQSEPNTEAYAASKGGILALTHALAVSLGPAVRVNAVSPGWIAVEQWQPDGRRETPALSEADHAQHPAGRVGRPEDVAAMVAYLHRRRGRFHHRTEFRRRRRHDPTHDLRAEGGIMDLQLEGRTAVVLAASRGLGFACAHALAAEGARVVLAGRHQGTIAEAAEHIRRRPARRR